MRKAKNKMCFSVSRTTAFVVIALGVLVFPFEAYPQQGPQEQIGIEKELYYDVSAKKQVEVARGEVLVKFRPSASASAVNALNLRQKVKTVARTRKLDIYRLKIPEGKTIDEVMGEYGKDPLVEYAEPNYVARAFSTVPNDAHYNLQWGFSNIQAELGWDVTQGSSDVCIAVIDTGVDLTHADLASKYWVNSDEVCNNASDDDSNGYVDDCYGWDFVSDDNDPGDQHGHGTHVSGIAAAASNNSTGVAGVAWNCRVMALRVLDSSGSGLMSDIADGIIYAADNGAKVINLSLGGYSYSSTLNDAVQYAHGKNCVVIAAAGNDNTTAIAYPAGCSNVIGVGATDISDNRAGYSNYNSSVDVSAPGGQMVYLHDPGGIYSTLPEYSVTLNGSGYYQDFDYLKGTSMASPFVSGLAALLFSLNPSWTNAQVESEIISTVDDLGSAGRDDYYGYGRINMYNALNSAPAVPAGFSAQSGQTSIYLSWTANTEDDLGGYKLYRSTLEAGSYSQITTRGASSTSYADAITGEGTYYYKISAYDAGGLESALSSPESAAIDITPPPAPTVDPVSSSANLASLTISGTMSADAAEILVNGSSSGVSYSGITFAPGTSWSYAASLSRGTNNFTIVARDEALNESPPVTISLSLTKFNIYPNPFTLGSSAGVVFAGLTGDERINIYTLAGELVVSHQMSAATAWTWDAKNTSGREVAKGVYLYLITNNSGFKEIGKIAIK